MEKPWITSNEAFNLVAGEYDRTGQYVSYPIAKRVAEEAILRRLKYGQLSSRSSFCRMVEESTTINATVQEVRDDLIPKLFWSSLEMCPLNSRELDWVSGDFTFKDYSGFFDCEGVAFNVHFEVANLPGLAANDGPEKVEAALIPAEPSAPPSARGRPAKWDWEGALAHLVTIANGIDGLEALATDELRQADVERAICDWFISKVGEAPVESEIRKRAAKVTLALSEAEKSRLAK